MASTYTRNMKGDRCVEYETMKQANFNAISNAIAADENRHSVEVGRSDHQCQSILLRPLRVARAKWSALSTPDIRGRDDHQSRSNVNGEGTLS